MPNTYIDTNAFNNNYSLDGENVTLIKDYISRSLGDVYISEVTVREHARHHSRSAKALIDAIAATTKKHGRPIMSKGAKLSSEAVSEKSYIRFMRERLQALGIQVLALPVTTVEEVLSRDLNEIKPFDSGGKGYRDFLIWKSILAHISLNPEMPDCYFVTSNSLDFSDGSGSLHATLQEEVDQTATGVTIKLYPTLPDFVQDVIKPAVISADEDEAKTAALLKAINRGEFFGLNVEKMVRSEIDHFERHEISGPAWYENVLLEEPIEITSLEDLSQTSVDNVYRLSSGQFLCEGSAMAIGTVTGYMYNRDLWATVPSDHIYVYDPNWNEHMSAVELAMVRVNVAFSFRVNETSGEVDDFELSELSLVMNDQSGELEFGFPQ
jgi:hypothetical protein